MMSKRGQGLSLNVIIVAALALIVLVVIAVIFTSNLGDTEKKINEVSDDSQLRLEQLRIGYGDCHPTASAEREFKSDFSSNEDSATTTLNDEISRCSSLPQDECQSDDCSWS
jgi:hypothetical protein